LRSTSSSKRREGPTSQAAAAVAPIESFPLALVVVDDDGSATGVNEAWLALSGLSRAASLGGGWADAVEPSHRGALVERLRAAQAATRRGAAAAHRAGSTECRLAVDGRGGRWTRWWWHPGASGGLVVCVADIDADKEREANLWQRATHDPLTGLLNRSQLLDLLDRALQRRDRADAPPAIVYVDLDGFKAVNDTGGHGAGDRVLRAAAERMAAAIRPSDAIARVGGDEFAVLCDELHTFDEVDAVAARVREAVTQLVDVDGEAFVLSATTGVAVATDDVTAEGLLARADAAMYAARTPPRGTPSVARDRGARHVVLRPEPVDVASDVADGSVRKAVDALCLARRLLADRWGAVAADQQVSRDAKERLAHAARLARAAVHALDPHNLQ
jgi:diguanylate cyclase (GGDEF)-like protein/PAS domain S-box-containing protein